MLSKIILQKNLKRLPTTQEMWKCCYDTNRTRLCELKQHSHNCTEKNVRKYFLFENFQNGGQEKVGKNI